MGGQDIGLSVISHQICYQHRKIANCSFLCIDSIWRIEIEKTHSELQSLLTSKDVITVMVAHNFGRCETCAFSLNQDGALLYDEDECDHADQQTYAGARTAPEDCAASVKVERQRLSKSVE